MGFDDDKSENTARGRWGWLLALVATVLLAGLVGGLAWNIVIGGFARAVAASVSGSVRDAWTEYPTLQRSDDALTRLDGLIEKQIGEGHLVSVTLYGKTGDLLYATKTRPAGPPAAPDDSVRAALESGKTAAVPAGNQFVVGGRRTQTLRITTPIRLLDEAPVVGVAVIFSPYETVRADAVRAVVVAVLIALLGGLVVFTAKRLAARYRVGDR